MLAVANCKHSFLIPFGSFITITFNILSTFTKQYQMHRC